MAGAVQFSITNENQAEVLAAAESARGGPPPATTPPAEETPVVEIPAKDGEAPATLEIPDPPEKPAEGEDDPLDLNPFYEEYANTGALSDESRNTIKARLVKAGFSNADDLIDQHMAGARADVEQARQRIFSHVGGEQAYSEMVKWAATSLSKEDIEEFNEAVKNPKMVKLAVTALQAQYKAAGAAKAVPAATNPKRVTPQANVSSSFEPIRSDQQVADLVSDKRYLTDPGYRQVVDQRIEASMKAGYI
jgi:hypothetical protein